MIDVDKLEKRIAAIDKKYSLSVIDADTFSAIVLLTEKKVQFKNLMKTMKIGHRRDAMLNIIKDEFPNADVNRLSWFLFKNGYIKTGTLYIFLFISLAILFFVSITIISNYLIIPLTILAGIALFLFCVVIGAVINDFVIG